MGQGKTIFLSKEMLECMFEVILNGCVGTKRWTLPSREICPIPGISSRSLQFWVRQGFLGWIQSRVPSEEKQIL